jgi:hypothetical protein
MEDHMVQSTLRDMRLIGPLSLLAFCASMAVSQNLPAANANVGFVSAVRGKPQVLDADGRLGPVTLMQPLYPGAMIVLRSNESVAICHEGASRTFRVDGAGAAYVGHVGINSDPGGPRVAATGACAVASTPSETGGVLLRSLRPPASAK